MDRDLPRSSLIFWGSSTAKRALLACEPFLGTDSARGRITTVLIVDRGNTQRVVFVRQLRVAVHEMQVRGSVG